MRGWGVVQWQSAYLLCRSPWGQFTAGGEGVGEEKM